METKAYPSKISMLQDLVKLVEGLDLNSSALLPNFSFSTDKKKVYHCPNAMTFVDSFNKEFGDTFDMNGCRSSGRRGSCILTFLDKKEIKSEVTNKDLPEEEKKETTKDKVKSKAGKSKK